MIAYAFLQHRRLASARREKKSPTSTKPAGRAPRHHHAPHPIAAVAMPPLPNMDQNTTAA